MRKSLVLLMVFVALFSMATVASAKKVFRMAVETARDSDQAQTAQLFAKLVNERTNGEIEIKVFTDSSLGAFQAVLTGVRAGTIDMAVSGGVNFAGYVPHIGLFDCLFMFQNAQHAYDVLDGPIGKKILDQFRPHGMTAIGYWENGWRQLTNNKRPIKTPEDLKGMKMRTTGSPNHIESFKLLGTNPVPMALAELYTALETGAVDGQEHPIGVFYTSKFQEVQKFVSLSGHAYSALLVIMNNAKWDSLTKEQQDIITQASKEAAAWQRKYNNDNIMKIADELEKMGLEVVREIDTTPFYEIIKPGHQTFIDKFGGADIVEEINKLRK